MLLDQLALDESEDDIEPVDDPLPGGPPIGSVIQPPGPDELPPWPDDLQ